MKERNKAVPAVYLFLEIGGRWLFALRKNTGYQDGNWNVPSGHVEEKELPTQAMIREAKEELDVCLLGENLELVHVSFRPGHDETGSRADYFFKTRVWVGDIRNAEPDKCAKLEWFSPDLLPSNITPHVRHAFERMRKQKGISYSELGERFLKSNGVWMLD